MLHDNYNPWLPEVHQTWPFSWYFSISFLWSCFQNMFLKMAHHHTKVQLNQKGFPIVKDCNKVEMELMDQMSQDHQQNTECNLYFTSMGVACWTITNGSTSDLIDKYQLQWISCEFSVTEMVSNITPLRNHLVMNKIEWSCYGNRANPFKRSKMIWNIQGIDFL